MRVDGDRVGTSQRVEGLAGHAGLPAVGQQREESAVRRIDMQTRAVPLAEVGDAINAIDHPEPGGPERRHDRADATGLEALLQRSEVERAVTCRGHGLVPRTDDFRDTRVGVVRLRTRQHNLVRMEATCHPERLEIRDRARRGEVGEVLLLMQHRCDLVDRLTLEVRRRRPAVERVVVRVEQHCHRVARPRHRMRRLEHLAEVLRIREGVRASKAIGELIEGLAPCRRLLATVVGERGERQ